MMSNNMRIYQATREVPAEAKKTIGGGRLKGFTDINPMWRIKALTEQFGPAGEGWYTVLTDKQFVTGASGEIAVFVDIELYVKYGDEWSKPIFGTGGSMFIANERSGLYTSDEAIKMAYTDAISVACKALGFAADIYFDKDSKSRDNRTKYDQDAERAAQPPSTRGPAPIVTPCIVCGKPVPKERADKSREANDGKVYCTGTCKKNDMAEPA